MIAIAGNHNGGEKNTQRNLVVISFLTCDSGGTCDRLQGPSGLGRLGMTFAHFESKIRLLRRHVEGVLKNVDFEQGKLPQLSKAGDRQYQLLISTEEKLKT